MFYGCIGLALERGYTSDGWQYRIFWDEGDSRLKVELTNEKKEVWVLDALTVVDIEQAQDYASEIGYRLEHEGSGIIRGVKAVTEGVLVPRGTPYAARLVFEKATPMIPKLVAGVEPVHREERIPAQVTAIPQKKIRGKELLGLGNEGRRRLRILFESTLLGVGIKLTRVDTIRAEEVIYELDTKYKFSTRQEAEEKATLDLLNIIEKGFYFKS
jgi:hypothetical protein